MIYTLWIIISFVLTVSTVFAQTMSVGDVVVSSDGSIVITGSGAGQTFQNTILGEYFTMKLNAEGEVQWVINEGNTYDGRGIVQDAQNATYFFSEERQNSALIQLVKVSAEGSEIWRKNLIEGHHASLDISPDNYLCVSISDQIETSNGDQESKIQLSRFTSDGVQEWSQSIMQDEGTSQKSTTFATNSGCYLGGEMRGTLSVSGTTSPFSLSSENKSSFLSFFSSSGQAEWARLVLTSLSYPRQILADAQDDVYMVGLFKGPAVQYGDTASNTIASSGEFDVFISKISSTGDVQWAQGIGGLFYDDANSIALTSTGEVVVLGSWGERESYGNTSSSLFLSQFDSEGIPQSSFRDGMVTDSPRSDWKFSSGTGISIGPDNSYVVVGTLLGTASMGANSPNETTIVGEFDMFVAKYDADDQLIWTYASAYHPPKDPFTAYYPRFLNLEEGNRWEFRSTNVWGNDAPGPYLVFDIQNESVVDGQIQKVIRAREYEEDGVLRDESMCLIKELSPGEYTSPELLSCSESGSQCRCLRPKITIQVDSSAQIELQDRVTIGSWDYWVDASATYVFSGSGTGGSGGGSHWKQATEIGMLQFGSSWNCHWSQQNCVGALWKADLIYAHVNGRVYGATSVGIEGAPIDVVPTSSIGEPFPNPTSGAFQIQIRLSSAQTLTVRAYDLLGRELLLMNELFLPEGPHTLRFETNDWPAGVQLLRIVGDTFESTKQLIALD